MDTEITDIPPIMVDRVNVSRLALHIKRHARKIMTPYLIAGQTDDESRLDIVYDLCCFMTALQNRKGVFESYTVRCDDSNNPPDEIANGNLTTNIVLTFECGTELDIEYTISATTAGGPDDPQMEDLRERVAAFDAEKDFLRAMKGV